MRTFAIADIHGCSKTFQKLLAEISLTRNDMLFLLGDYVNKGPDSKGVLDSIFTLIQNGIEVKALRGNHDQMLLDALSKNYQEEWLSDEEKKQTLQSFGVRDVKDIPEKYIDFIRSLPFYFETPDFLLVHAGFNFSASDIFSDQEAMLNIKDFEVDLKRTGERTVIHGHVPQALESIKKFVDLPGGVIKIDGGCVYFHNMEYGNLIALQLDNKRLFVQKNIDYPYPVKKKS